MDCYGNGPPMVSPGGAHARAVSAARNLRSSTMPTVNRIEQVQRSSRRCSPRRRSSRSSGRASGPAERRSSSSSCSNVPGIYSVPDHSTSAMGSSGMVDVQPSGPPADPTLSVFKPSPKRSQTFRLSSPLMRLVQSANDIFEEKAHVIQKCITTMAVTRVDTMEDEEFSVTRIKQNVERLYAAAQPFPDFVMFMYGVLMWESPLKTAFVVAVYVGAVMTERVALLSIGILIITLAYHGCCHKQMLEVTGFAILFQDAQTQPPFADASRKKKLEARSQSKWGPSATLITRPDQLWHEFRDRVMAFLQLQTRDLADLLEKCHSLILWRRPHATVIILIQLILGIGIMSYITERFLMKTLGLLFGFYLFVMVPLRFKFPRYRRLFSPSHLFLWPFPTQAEYAIEQLAVASQPIVTRIETASNETRGTHGLSQNPVQPLSLDQGNLAGGVSDGSVPGPEMSPGIPLRTQLSTSETGVASESVDRTQSLAQHTGVLKSYQPLAHEWICWWNRCRGTLRIFPYERQVEFWGHPGSFFGPDELVFSIPMHEMIRIKKLHSRDYLFVKNAQILITLSNGECVLLEHLSRQDEVFSILAAASAEKGRRWSIPGT